MRQLTTKAIVMRRIDYGDNDRIVNFLTPSIGKVGALVRGVRKQSSRLAGGIELFSESEITFLQTKGDLMRITQARLIEHWGDFLGDLPRMMFAYEAMKSIDKLVPEDSGGEYYDLLRNTLEHINILNIDLSLVKIYFWMNLLKLSGHSPALDSDSSGTKLSSSDEYNFVIEDMMFVRASDGGYNANHVKILRLAMTHSPRVLSRVKNVDNYSPQLVAVSERIARYHLHLTG